MGEQSNQPLANQETQIGRSQQVFGREWPREHPVVLASHPLPAPLTESKHTQPSRSFFQDSDRSTLAKKLRRSRRTNQVAFPSPHIPLLPET